MKSQYKLSLNPNFIKKKVKLVKRLHKFLNGSKFSINDLVFLQVMSSASGANALLTLQCKVLTRPPKRPYPN